ncbi:MAG: hypothetical protein AAGU11_15485 [Syntrophobacteraceae bacterium]
MKPWILLDVAPATGDGLELRLYRRDDEFSIRAGRFELMNSRMHGSEDALGELACSRIAGRPGPRVLVGGLGMGYTLAAVLRGLSLEGKITVAELMPAVVKWNRGLLGALAGHPLRDERVTVCETDVARLLLAERQAYDAILLDVDNGPKGLTRVGNDWLYGRSGLGAAFAALRPGGVLAVWSAGPDQAFGNRTRKIGFKVEELRVHARGASPGKTGSIRVDSGEERQVRENAGGRARHIIWIAVRPAQ